MKLKLCKKKLKKGQGICCCTFAVFYVSSSFWNDTYFLLDVYPWNHCQIWFNLVSSVILSVYKCCQWLFPKLILNIFIWHLLAKLWREGLAKFWRECLQSRPVLEPPLLHTAGLFQQPAVFNLQYFSKHVQKNMFILGLNGKPSEQKQNRVKGIFFDFFCMYVNYNNYDNIDW